MPKPSVQKTVQTDPVINDTVPTAQAKAAEEMKRREDLISLLDSKMIWRGEHLDVNGNRLTDLVIKKHEEGRYSVNFLVESVEEHGNCVFTVSVVNRQGNLCAYGSGNIPYKGKDYDSTIELRPAGDKLNYRILFDGRAETKGTLIRL